MAKAKRNFYTTENVKDICFPVEKLEAPYSSSNDDAAFDVVVYPPEFPKGRRVASCADRYELISNEEIFKHFEDKLKEDQIEFTVSYEMVNYAIFTAKYNLTSKEGNNLAFEVSEGDEIFPQITVRHSYNSQAKYSFIFGYFRMVCSNGLVIPVEEMNEYNFSVTGKHTKFFHENFATLNEKLDLFIETQETTFKPVIEGLTNNTFVSDYAERIEEVMNATKIATSSKGGRNAKDNKENVIEIANIALNESTMLDMPVNDWLIYNAINAFLYDNDRNATADETRRKKDSEVMAYMLAN